MIRKRLLLMSSIILISQLLTLRQSESVNVTMQLKIINSLSSLPDNIHSKFHKDIDFFTGCPLFLSINIANISAYKSAFTHQNKEKIQNSNGSIAIGSDTHPWIEFLKVRMYFEDINTTNMLNNYSLENHFCGRNNRIAFRNILDKSSEAQIFFLSEEKLVRPGKYFLIVEYDNREIANSIGINSIYTCSNFVEVILKKPETDFDKAQIFYHRGMKEMWLEQYENAMNSFFTAIKVCPDFPTPYRALAMYYSEKRQLIRAKEFYEQFIEIVKSTKIELWSHNEMRKKIDIDDVLYPLERINSELQTH